jgi:GxxExxY protein
MVERALTGTIIACAIEVHRTLGGPGLLESVYEEALVWELEAKGLSVQRQVLLPIAYKGQLLANPLRLDLLVENQIVIEAKSLITYNPIFESQLLTYLRLANLKVGLVINFGERYVRDGIHRVINT